MDQTYLVEIEIVRALRVVDVCVDDHFLSRVKMVLVKVDLRVAATLAIP